MNAEERLKKLMKLESLVNALSVDVTRLRSESQKQVAAIRESIAEGVRRCTEVSNWDGKQPDLWLKNGRLWRKPTEADIGKSVRVGHFGADPASMEAVRLVGFYQEAGQHDSFSCEGSRGQRVLWPIAWIEFEDEDTVESEKAQVSVQVEGELHDELIWGWSCAQEDPFDPINNPAPVYRKGQCRLMNESEIIEAGDFFWRNVDQSQCQANFTLGMKVKDAVARGREYNELWVFYRPIEATQSDNSKETPRIVDAYEKLIQSDSNFAWTIFCNLAMMAQDAGASHKESNERAADLMRNWFGVDVRKFVQWQYANLNPQVTAEIPSNADSVQFKPGDKVWVRCEVASTDEHYAVVRYELVSFLARPEDCKPVEPKAEEPKAIDADYRDATDEDIAKVMRGEKVEARFRDFDHQDWNRLNGKRKQFLTGVEIKNGKYRWVDEDNVLWFICQVYDPKKD